MLTAKNVFPGDIPQPLFRDGIIAETRAEAYNLAVEYLVEGYEKQYEGRGHGPSEQGDLDHDVLREEYDPKDLIEDRFIVGNPDDWVEQLQAYEDVLGTDHVVAASISRG